MSDDDAALTRKWGRRLPAPQDWLDEVQEKLDWDDLSWNELARRAGTSTAAVTRIKQVRRSEWVLAFARVLGIPEPLEIRLIRAVEKMERSQVRSLVELLESLTARR